MARNLIILICFLGLAAAGPLPETSLQWVVYDGYDGPGKGMQVVLISGDEEYRSEEALPQLGKILAKHHGFKCTVLFAVDPADGSINPEKVDNIPGLEALDTADLMVIATRFRELPDSQMYHIDRYLRSGGPVIGMRTATHAFRYSRDSRSRYKKYDFRGKDWPGGFGRQILGETWISHHGHHGVQSTRGIIVRAMQNHPIARGCEDIWGPTDVYEVTLPMIENCQPLVLGQVVSGMQPTDQAVEGSYSPNGKRQQYPNDPMMPIAWIRTYSSESGREGRVFATTMGASQDLLSEGFRRLLVNAVYWTVGLEDRIPERADVSLVGDYSPTPFGFGKHKRGLKPSDFTLRP